MFILHELCRMILDNYSVHTPFILIKQYHANTREGWLG